MDGPLRLDKIISACGYLSRAEAKKMAKAGKVTVNGVCEKDVSRKVDPKADIVSVDGNEISYKKHIWLVMNKPGGYLSAAWDTRHRTVFDLLKPPYTGMGLFIAGRLDRDATGMLILTNDGKSAHDLLSPKKHVPKTYYVTVSGRLEAEDARLLKDGIELSDFLCKPAIMEIIDSGITSSAYITITEGKFHQVKRMFASLGKKVTSLKRVKMGSLGLPPELSEGQYRELSSAEVQKLLQS